MKNLLLILSLIIITFSNCKKAKSPYGVEPEPTDTTNILNSYNNGGTLPTSTVTVNNELNGTNWLITKIQIGLASTNMNDTIKFIDNSHYKVNSNTLILTYNLYQASANKTLTFNNFMPCNGWNSSGIVGVYFASYGKLIGVEFKDLYNSNNKFNLWMEKI